MTTVPNATTGVLLAPTPSMRMSGALAGGVSGAALAACAFFPVPVVAVVFLGLALVLAWGWPRLMNLPSPRGTSAVLGLTALALTATMVLSHEHDRSRWAGAVLCVGLIGSFLHQLLRQDGRPRLVMSLAGTALGLGVLGAGSYVIAAVDEEGSHRLLLAAGLAVVVGALLEGVCGASRRRLVLGAMHVALGALVGLAAMVTGTGLGASLASGALSGLLSWACLRTTVTLATSSHTRAQLAAGSASALICCVAPVAAHAVM